MKCSVCGVVIERTGANQKYCKNCSITRLRNRNKENQKKWKKSQKYLDFIERYKAKKNSDRRTPEYRAKRRSYKISEEYKKKAEARRKTEKYKKKYRQTENEATEKCSDRYIKRVLRQEKIPRTLKIIEHKRLQILLKRAIKKLEESLKQGG